MPVHGVISPVSWAFLLLMPSFSAPKPLWPRIVGVDGLLGVWEAGLEGDEEGDEEGDDDDEEGAELTGRTEPTGDGVIGAAGPSARGTCDAQPAATITRGRRTDPRRRTVRRMACNPFGFAVVLQCDAASTELVRTNPITVG